MAATLLKGQILKVLSRFAKDVDASQLKFSSLSQAFLSDLVLNEEVLSTVLELPIWMKLTRAVCSRVSIQIPWTHLSSQPIRISLDEMYIDMETCSELRPFSESHPTTSGDYGRTEMAIDGMLVTVNALEINFRAPSFHASILVNRIKVFSTSPEYENSHDLRMTRLKDESRDAILVFKCISWQTVRIEALSGSNSDTLNRSSIRLITSAGQARIALKKHLSTCELMASRLQIILDDLLWVLTPSQLKSALSVLQELQMLASTADDIIRTKKAAKKLKSTQGAASRARRPAPNSTSAKIAQYFDKIDIIETSYHFHLTKLNLHICDEARGPQHLLPAKYEDAAILIELECLKLDYYPYHIPSTTRKHWLLYRQPDPHYVSWQIDILGDYLQQIERNIPDLQMNPLHYLMYAVCVFGVEDFRVNNMTTLRSQKHKDSRIKAEFPLCCSLKKPLHLPKQCAAAHLEYILHYYPQEVPFHAPPHILHFFCNPVQITLDVPTLDWFTLVCAELFSSQESQLPVDLSNVSIPDVVCRFEFLLPKGICPVELPESGNLRDRSELNGLQMQSGRVVITNTQTGRDRTLKDALKTMEVEKAFLEANSTFPSSLDDPDIRLILEHVASPTFSTSTLWSITADPVWVEFVDLKKEKSRPVTFVEPFPACIWVMPLQVGGVSPAKVIFAYTDIAVPSMKLQSTQDGYNVIMHSLDSAFKVFDSLMENCKELFAAAKEASGDSVLITAVTSLRRLEYTLMIESPKETRGSLSSDQTSEASQRPGSVDNLLAASPAVSESKGTVSYSSSVSLRDDFEEFLPRNLDAETTSMRSVMSESSIVEFGSILGLDDLSGALSTIGSTDDGLLVQIDSTVELHVSGWETRSPDLSNKNMIRLLTVQISDIDVVFVSMKNVVFTKLTCGDLLLKPAADDLLNGTLTDHFGDLKIEAPGHPLQRLSKEPKVALRFQSDGQADGTHQNFLTLLCQDCSLSCSTDASGRIGAFFKTDLIGQPMPMLLTLRKFGIILTDFNGKSPSSGLRMDHLTFSRGKDGIFTVGSLDPDDASEENSPKTRDFSLSEAQERMLFLRKKQTLIARELQFLQDRLAEG